VLRFPYASLLTCKYGAVTIRLDSRPWMENSERKIDGQMVAVWDVKLPDPVPLIDGIDDWGNPLRELVSLLSSRPDRFTWLQVGLPGSDELFDAHLWLLGDDAVKDDAPVSFFEQLAPLRALPDPCRAISRWLRDRDDFRMVRARLLGFGHLPLTFEEQRIMNVAQTAEALHRLLWDRPVRPKNEHRRWVREALHKSRPERRMWAKQVLGNANKLSLATRIEEVVSHAVAIGLFLAPADPSRFASDIAGARNTPAHGGRLPLDRTERDRLYYTFQGLDWLLRVVLLSRLGLSASDVQSRLAGNPAFRRLAEKLEWGPPPTPPPAGTSAVPDGDAGSYFDGEDPADDAHPPTGV
jgi:hypothetical protein